MRNALEKLNLPDIETQVKNPEKYTGGAPVDGYIDSYQAAQMLNIHWHTMQNYIRSGRLPATKIGKKWRIRVEVFEDFKKGKYSTNLNKPLTDDELETIKKLVLDAIATCNDSNEINALQIIQKKIDILKTC